MSDAFAYLSVLLSIVIGLAMAEILQGYGLLLVSRAKVKLYAPPLIWSATMLLMATQFWWASFGLAYREHWNFAAFCAVLLQTIMMYMGSALVLPNARSDQNIDLREHYYREAGPFFTFGLMFLAIGFIRDFLLDRMLGPIHIGFMALFAAMAVLALVVRRPRVHEIIAPVMAVTIIFFFVSLFRQI